MENWRTREMCTNMNGMVSDLEMGFISESAYARHGATTYCTFPEKKSS